MLNTSRNILFEIQRATVKKIFCSRFLRMLGNPYVSCNPLSFLNTKMHVKAFVVLIITYYITEYEGVYGFSTRGGSGGKVICFRE